ncbi:MAG: ATP-dependent metallopeptidase FtsH/Yme1/Tma family protein, partial [Firmicutes bacterium]|nr:ATP-dependent metallopeptidase FtsH/Yme1/Tma family protein [Bacillota bacterium]
MKKEVKPPQKKSWFYYYTLVVLIVCVFNLFVLPLFRGTPVVQVNYSTFIDMVESGQVKEVQITPYQIVFTDTAEEMGYYKTGVMDDPGLRQLLDDHDVEYGAQVVKQRSLFGQILGWILPFAFFIFIGQMMSRRMMGNMGNAMSFGKSSAKV